MKSIFDGRGSIATFLARTFAPREIILRANGRLSYLRLSSGLQKSAVAVMALLAGWSVYASAGYFVHRDGVADRDRQIELRDLAYLDLETRFGQALARETRLEKRVAGLGLSLQRGFEITAALRQEREVQQGVLNQFSDRVTLRADFVERTVALTGLDPDKLVHDSIASRLGKGGPLIPVGKVAADLGPESGFVAAVDGLNEQWSRWTALQEAVRTLPLAAPLDQYWVSSSFGERKDPITGEVARHEGLDIVAPLGARVLAPAPGTVVVAERHKRFGRLIEIDHGRGLTTRYAHLSKILVEVGQQVEHRQEIGVMGSSGRSTGPHVHYEVRYRDQPLDPEKFLMAGWRLFKG
jgi:murein DD-endopeptidase MepM/ murein hydrolase activator NlpD